MISGFPVVLSPLSLEEYRDPKQEESSDVGSEELRDGPAPQIEWDEDLLEDDTQNGKLIFGSDLNENMKINHF